jgi:hypothetical protein
MIEWLEFWFSCFSLCFENKTEQSEISEQSEQYKEIKE